MCVCTCSVEMGSVGAERRRPTPAQTPEERDVWRDGGRAGWRDVGREGWREGRESGVVQSYSFDSYQLEEEEISKDAPERGVLALSEPGERLSDYMCVCVHWFDRFKRFSTTICPFYSKCKVQEVDRTHKQIYIYVYGVNITVILSTC